MHVVGVLFEILDGKYNVPYGWSKVTGDLMFDGKINFTYNDLQLLDSRETLSLIGSTFTCTISRESTRIDFTHPELNGLDVFASYVINSYFQAPSCYECYVTCGAELGQ